MTLLTTPIRWYEPFNNSQPSDIDPLTTKWYRPFNDSQPVDVSPSINNLRPGDVSALTTPNQLMWALWLVAFDHVMGTLYQLPVRRCKTFSNLQPEPRYSRSFLVHLPVCLVRVIIILMIIITVIKGGWYGPHLPHKVGAQNYSMKRSLSNVPWSD